MQLYTALCSAMPDQLTEVEDCMGFVDAKTGLVMLDVSYGCVHFAYVQYAECVTFSFLGLGVYVYIAWFAMHHLV